MTYLGFSKRMATGLAAAVAACGLTAAGAAASGSGGVGPAGDGTQAASAAFPVKGKHSYGDGLGAGRGHQGQDLMAKCGKPIVAAQPGRVQVRDYQASGAGNYVVIDGKGKLEDTVYMHMLRRPSVRKGQKVSAGDVIGVVGSTGRSTACHLHFEMWSGGGWYDGGSPVNPKPFLRRLDRDH